MKIFDFSLLVGTDPRSSAKTTSSDLAGYLDSGEVRGIVTSLAGAYYDFEAGNTQTLEIAGRDARLAPGLTVDPRRVDAAGFDFAAAATEGFKAFVLFPAVQRWLPSHPALFPLASGASRAGLPIVIHVERRESVAAIASLAREVRVPVIALGFAYGSLGEIVAAGTGVDNLLFGMSLFAGLDNIEALVERLGAERLVFDSGEPRWSREPALSVLLAAAIGEGQREQIAHGNAEAVFGGAP